MISFSYRLHVSPWYRTNIIACWCFLLYVMINIAHDYHISFLLFQMIRFHFILFHFISHHFFCFISFFFIFFHFIISGYSKWKWGNTAVRRLMVETAVMGEYFHIYRSFWRYVRTYVRTCIYAILHAHAHTHVRTYICTQLLYLLTYLSLILPNQIIRLFGTSMAL